MQTIVVNGQTKKTAAGNLVELLVELGYDGASVVTAVDGEFISQQQRRLTQVVNGIAIEVLQPVQGG